MYRAVLGEGEGEDSPNGGRLDEAEGLIVVHPEALSEASKGPTSLVAIQSTIVLELVTEDPLVGDHVGALGGHDKSQVWLASRAAYSSIVRR